VTLCFYPSRFPHLKKSHSHALLPIFLQHLAPSPRRYTDTLSNLRVAHSAQVAARNAKRAAEQIAADNARAATVATALAAAQSAAFAAVQAFIQSLPEPANFAPFLATYVAAQSQEAAASEQQQAAISKTNQNAVAAQNQASQVSSNDSLFQLSIFAIS
jgi:hypothetical protein